MEKIQDFVPLFLKQVVNLTCLILKSDIVWRLFETIFKAMNFIFLATLFLILRSNIKKYYDSDKSLFNHQSYLYNRYVFVWLCGMWNATKREREREIERVYIVWDGICVDFHFFKDLFFGNCSVKCQGIICPFSQSKKEERA